MTDAMYTDPNRHMILCFCSTLPTANANGDPDAGNLPRVDPENQSGSGHRCLSEAKSAGPYGCVEERQWDKIYVQNRGVALNDLHQRAYNELNLKRTGSKQKREDVEKAKEWMCQNFYDIRTFGAVDDHRRELSSVRGPCRMRTSPVR